jgi:Uma2 family endonuclease
VKRWLPRPEDLHLIGEVSDSTLAFDLVTKAGLYARAGVPEYWVIDIAARRMIVHRDPVGGKYQSVTGYAANQPVAPLAAPSASFRSSDTFAVLDQS